MKNHSTTQNYVPHKKFPIYPILAAVGTLIVTGIYSFYGVGLILSCAWYTCSRFIEALVASAIFIVVAGFLTMPGFRYFRKTGSGIVLLLIYFQIIVPILIMAYFLLYNGITGIDLWNNWH